MYIMNCFLIFSFFSTLLMAGTITQSGNNNILHGPITGTNGNLYWVKSASQNYMIPGGAGNQDWNSFVTACSPPAFPTGGTCTRIALASAYICQQVDGGWSDFGSWYQTGSSGCSNCSYTIYYQRDRSCTNPTPYCNGSYCSGSSSDYTSGNNWCDDGSGCY